MMEGFSVRKSITVSALALSALIAGAPAYAGVVKSATFLGEADIESLLQVDGTTLGGLSGLTGTGTPGEYLAISDDRADPRLYRLNIDMGDGTLDQGDVTVTGVERLFAQDGSSLGTINPDPEAIALIDGQVAITSERNANGLFPQVLTFDDNFRVFGELAVDEKFNQDGTGTKGVRNNLGFESLTVSPDSNTVFTATENALIQDGGTPTLTEGSASRIIRYEDGVATGEFVYLNDPIAEPSNPVDAFQTSGLVELLAISDDRMIALERSFSVGAPEGGYVAKLYEISLVGADDVSDIDALTGNEKAVRKRLISDLEVDFGITADNLEGLAFGPTRLDGLATLLIVADDNFSAFGPQRNQFVAIGLDLQPIPVPAAAPLMLAGLVGLSRIRRRAA